MQKIMIRGNLTADPILSEREWINKETGEILKAKVCNFTVAAEDSHGERKRTEFFKVNVWRGFGELCAETLKKGHSVLVFGSVYLKNYTDKNNNHRSVMEIKPDAIEFLNGKTIKIEEDQPAPIPEDTDGMDY